MAKNVVVYTQPGWGPCHSEVEYLSQKGIEFTEKNIRKDQEALQELLNLGARGTPATVIDGEVVLGFDRAKLDELLSR